MNFNFTVEFCAIVYVQKETDTFPKKRHLFHLRFKNVSFFTQKQETLQKYFPNPYFSTL